MAEMLATDQSYHGIGSSTTIGFGPAGCIAVRQPPRSILVICGRGSDIIELGMNASVNHLFYNGRRQMFLVEDRFPGITYSIFTWRDPRDDGYAGALIEDVTLDYDQDVHSWPSGHARPEASLGRSRSNPKQFKVFKFSADLEQAADYQHVSGTFAVFQSWSDYMRLRLAPPDPEHTLEEDWLDYLDRIDEAARRRRSQPDELDEPRGTDREAVAEWVAHNHILADSGIREVWYLPQGAPPDEIRLLELSDRLPGNESRVEAIDFGLDIEGAPFRLLVADVTTEQLKNVQQDSSRLPNGWSLDHSKIIRRRRGA